MDSRYDTSLTPVTEGIWCAEGPVSPGPGFSMQTRMTIVRLPDETLWVHSPLLLPDDLAREIESLGKVSHVIAPNLFHHLYLKHAQQHWNEARYWAPAGLGKKNKTVDLDEELSEGDGWDGVFSVHAVTGMPRFREFVFLHKPTKTLIVTDLVFNCPTGHNAATRFFFRLAGTRDRLAVSRLFKSLIKDKPEHAASCAALIELDFERVIMAHGNVLEANAHERFAKALRSDLPALS